MFEHFLIVGAPTGMQDDPGTEKEGQILYHYPDDGRLKVQDLPHFCFPQGVALRRVTRWGFMPPPTFELESLARRVDMIFESWRERWAVYHVKRAWSDSGAEDSRELVCCEIDSCALDVACFHADSAQNRSSHAFGNITPTHTDTVRTTPTDGTARGC
jgi:hypothetical protein